MPFDKKERKPLCDEAKNRWGNTAVWSEYEQKSAAKTDEEQRLAADRLMKIFKDFGKLRALSADDPAVQSAVAGVKDYITKHFYTCTDEIFAGLGEMYAVDPRFRKNIDLAGGAGTAEFVSKAIRYYCKNKQ